MRTKFGALVVAGRGKLGGHVASSDKGGSNFRSKSSPVNNPTSYQSEIRQRFIYLVKLWKTLTEYQRATWIAASRLYPQSDKIGNISFSSGFQMFTKLNSHLLQIGQSINLEAPAKTSVQSIKIDSGEAWLQRGNLFITFSETINSDTAVLIYATLPKSSGISNFNSYYRFIGYLENEDFTEYNISDLYNTKFGEQLDSQSYLSIKAIPVNKNTGHFGVASNIRMFSSTDSPFLKDFVFPLLFSGTGTGVSTMQCYVLQDTSMSIDGLGKFYTDAAGTLNESDTVTLLAGPLQTFYIRLPSGSASISVLNGNSLFSSFYRYTVQTNSPFVNVLNTFSFPSVLTYVHISSENYITGDIKNFPISFSNCVIYGSNTLYGDISTLPPAINDIWIIGQNIISGNISQIPPSLKYLYLHGKNSITGILGTLPSGFLYLNVTGWNTISGNVGEIPDSINDFTLYGFNIVSVYTSKSWVTKPSIFRLAGYSSLITSHVDQLLIDFDTDLVWGPGNIITITGNCQPRSAASDAAVANMILEDATITTN